MATTLSYSIAIHSFSENIFLVCLFSINIYKPGTVNKTEELLLSCSFYSVGEHIFFK